MVDKSSPSELRGNPAPEDQDTSSSSHELPMEWRAQAEPGSGKHSAYTHFPKDPNCDICLKTKITRSYCRRRAGTVVPKAENCGDLITADHKILNEESESRNNHRYAVVVQDLATQWLESYPCKNKNFSGDPEEPNEVPGADKEAKRHLHWQFLWKFGKSCEELSWNHCTSTTLHRSETNAIAEGAVRRVKEGTSAVLLQSGVGHEWWADSTECYCYLRNIQDHLADGKTPYERRFGIPFNEPVMPFAAMVECHPISAKDLSKLHQFGPKVLPGRFLGYALNAGGNLERRHSSSRHWRVGAGGRIWNLRRKAQC